MSKKLIIVFAWISLFLGCKVVNAAGGTPIITYTINGISASTVINPIVHPVQIGFTADEDIPNWVSVKIEKADDSSIYKIFSPITTPCDGTNQCSKTWNGDISPTGKTLVNGVYNVIVHIQKDTADPVTYNLTLTSPYTITVTSNVETSSSAQSNENTGGAGLVSSNSDNGTSLSTSAPTIVATAEKKSKTEEPKIKTQITSKTLGFIGLPVNFSASATGYSGEQLFSGKYFWNFGDGDSKEINLADSQPFTHTYFYPGDYVISLDYYSNYYENSPIASSQITIKIIPADISISKVGDEKDFFIELTNNTDYNADISNWFLSSGQKSFIIPRNTILAPKKTLIISPRITNFSIEDKNTLRLMTPEREVAFDYASSIVPIVPTKIAVQPKISTTAIQPPELPEEAVLASAISSGVANNNPTSKLQTTITFILSFVFIGASAGAVYFIRRKKIIHQTGSDFKILDE